MAYVLNITRLASNPDVTMKQLGAAITADPTFAAEVLRTANSPAFGLRCPVATPLQAAVVLGTRSLRNLAICFAVRDSVRRSVFAPAVINAFWEDSLRRAVAARLLAANLGLADPEEAFTVGLLQEFGLFAWVARRLDMVKVWRELLGIPSEERRDAELARFGVTHTELAAELTEGLGLPARISEALRHHHRPDEASDPATVRLAHVAGLADLACAAWSGRTSNARDRLAMLGSFERALAEQHQVPSETTARWIDRVADELETTADVLGMRVPRQPRFAEILREAQDGLSELASSFEEAVDVASERARLVAHLAEANTRLEDLANLDGLTGLANRRHFELRAVDLLMRASLRGQAVSVMMFDIDFFKRVNDQYGHAAGDAVLRAVGTLLRRGTRQSDVVGRLGGEEFGLVLNGIAEGSARSVAENIREAIGSLRFQFPTTEFRVTATVGGTSYAGTVRDSDDAAELLSALLARADDHLYTGKRAGRDRVVWG
jgi:two-component system cell cycle response regulator